MVVRAFVFETRGGALLQEFEPASLSWSIEANEPDTVNVSIDLSSSTEASRDWRSLSTPWKHSIAIDAGGRLIGGPIMPHDFDDDGGVLQIAARGFGVMLDRFPVLPVEALTEPLTIDGQPNADLDTTISGYDLGTIGKKLVEQVCEWPGWDDIPIGFHDDRPGIHERIYAGIDRKSVWDALSDLSSVEGGPDIRFRLEWDGWDAFRWHYDSGTEAQPRLEGESVFVWDVSRSSALKVSTNPTRMGSVAWSEGGRTDDRTVVRMLYDPYLVAQGLPLLHLESKASTSTSSEDTLDAWNVETLRTARKPWQFWSFQVRADEPPYPSEYNVGDLIEVSVTSSTGFIESGSYRRRIASISGDEAGDWVTITCGEVYE